MSIEINDLPLWDSHIHLERSLRSSGETVASHVDALAQFKKLVRDVVCNSAASQVKRIDLRFNPIHWGDLVGDDEEFLRCIEEVVVEAASVGVDLHLFITVKRNVPFAEAERALEIAVSGRAFGICGVDFSSSYSVSRAMTDQLYLERVMNFEPSSLVMNRLSEWSTAAMSCGLEVAHHLGPFDSRNTMWRIVEEEACVRFGHGIYLTKDAALVRAVAARDILVEFCPTTLIRVHGAKHLAALDPYMLLAAGVRVAIGTDHPLELGTDFVKERALADEMLSQPPRWEHVLESLRVE